MVPPPIPLNSRPPTEQLRFYFTNGCPGDSIASLCNLAMMRARSTSVLAAARRLRNWTIFSLRVRRRRISGRRLGADMRVGSWKILSYEYNTGIRSVCRRSARGGDDATDPRNAHQSMVDNRLARRVNLLFPLLDQAVIIEQI